MPCRRTGNQSQIDRHACLCQLPANVHGNMMHSCNVCKCVKRHDLPPKPHQFIYPLPAKTFQKTPILLPIRAFCNLSLLRKRKIPRSRKRQTFALLFHEHPQSSQIIPQSQSRFNLRAGRRKRRKKLTLRLLLQKLLLHLGCRLGVFQQISRPAIGRHQLGKFPIATEICQRMRLLIVVKWAEQRQAAHRIHHVVGHALLG